MKVWQSLAVAIVVLPVAGFAQDAAPKAETILDRYVEVTGGKAAYEKRTGVMEKGTMEMVGRGIKGAMTNYMMAPDKAYSVIELEGVGQMEEGTNGVVAWERSALQGPRVKDGAEKDQTFEESTFNAPIRWREVYSKVETVGADKVNGEDCWKVVATSKSGHPETLYFSKKSGFLLRRTAKQSTQMGDIEVDASMSDYKDAGGVMEPRVMKQSFAGQEMVFHIDEINVNPEIPPNRFDLPDEIQALVKKASAPKAPAGKAAAGGKLTVYIGGSQVATETYSFESAGGKYTWSGSGEAKMGPMQLNIELYKIVTDDKYRPLEAELKTKMGQVNREVKTTFADGKAKNETASAKGPQIKEDAVGPDDIIMAFPLPVFPLSVLARRISFDTKEPQIFHAYLLGQKEVPVTTKYMGKEDVEFAGKTVSLHHVTGSVELQPGQPMSVDMWEDDSRTLIKLSASTQHIDVYQDGYEPKPAPPAPEPK
jgi:hypothetical protein